MEEAQRNLNMVKDHDKVSLTAKNRVVTRISIDICLLFILHCVVLKLSVFVLNNKILRLAVVAFNFLPMLQSSRWVATQAAQDCKIALGPVDLY